MKKTILVALIEGTLVFLGVLLGFYFDEVRENRQRENLLREDLKLLSFELTEDQDVNKEYLISVSESIDEIGPKLRTLDTLKFSEVLKVSNSVYTWNGNIEQKPYALDQMISNGSFSLIQNESLKKTLILDYPDARHQMLQHNALLENYNINVIKRSGVDEKVIRRETREWVIQQLKFLWRLEDYIETVVEVDSLIQVELERL